MRPRPAQPATAPVDVSAQVAALEAKALPRCRVEAEAILAGATNAELELTSTMIRPGGVAADPTGSAKDLWEAACWMAAAGGLEDLKRSFELIGRAERHQRLHTETVAEARRNPKRASGMLAGLGRQSLKIAADDASRLMEVIGHVRAGITSIDQFSGHRRWLALEALAAAPLTRLLTSGDQRTARALAAGLLERGPDQLAADEVKQLSDADLHRAGRYLRAMQILLPDDKDVSRDVLTELHRLGGDRWRRAIAPRLAGDAEEAALEDSGVYGLGRWGADQGHGGFQGVRARLDPVERGEDVLARAAGMLRTPRRYEGVSYGGPRPDLHGRLVRVEATPAAFREFCEAEAGNPTFCGYALTRRADDLELVARMAVRTSGAGDIEVRCVLPLGRSTRKVLRTMLADAQRHEDWPADLVDPQALTVADTPENAPVSRPYAFAGEEAPRRLRAGVDALLGRQSCAHPDGRWVPVGADGHGEKVEHPDGIALECPRCLRRRVAVLPLLALPREDPRLPDLSGAPDRGALLRREHAYRSLRGEPEVSDEELLGHLAAIAPSSLDPSLWASRPPQAEEGTPVRRRGALFGAPAR